ncbi:DsbE family thiol:disulfide interchange protein [Aquabacterium sp. A7-Y]|uniref:DsbE family thiol:disulfide interchange protein n=1 Tax=Aquabacterium sp. A7-Y TaxID=1349605 RepID=UPI00223E6352|nr:DsbE family thiol:disulfide interchange protein [Aquabacterium sp. A7-Y]MCW7538570.1 DsbE family thiol:disulfide interchange protein [Aquabacterium sp. A7-Y]
MTKRLRFVLPLGLFALLVGLLWRGLALDPRALPSPLIDKPAPAFALARLDDPDRMLRRDDLRGRVWLLNVWASWCAACLEEHATLIALSHSQAVPLIGLNYKDQRPQALAWLGRHGNPYASSVFDPDGRVGRDFGVYGVPETFVIDKEGRVRLRHAGPLTPEFVESRLRPLLEQLDGR